LKAGKIARLSRIFSRADNAAARRKCSADDLARCARRLRSRGLRGLIEAVGDGWRIAPSIVIEVRQPSPRVSDAARVS